MKTSRGERNNNPLNIRRSADQWEGACEEQTDKSLVQFKSLAYGYRAAWKVLQSYYDRFCRQGKPFTVRLTAPIKKALRLQSRHLIPYSGSIFRNMQP